MAKGKLVLLGSGETAPGMTKVHRELLSGLGEVRAVNLDTPYGFQLNVPQMTQKLVDYFKVSLQTDLKPLSFTNYEKSSGVERELFRQSVRDANYVFAGPGSPSYALAQWKGLDLQEDLLHVIDNGGVVCFSSAAALTLGAFTAPIYEIYKAGAEPYWLKGLDLMGLLGINCAVIPHFNNAEGQDYDTSCCYLGWERLEKLEEDLPEAVVTVGIDEHTALIIDIEERFAQATGKGSVQWGNNASRLDSKSGETISITQFTDRSKATAKQKILESSPSVLENFLERIQPLTEDEIQLVASMVKLKDENKHLPDSSTLIQIILDIRKNARTQGNFDLSDMIRNALLEANIEVSDSAHGATWNFRKFKDK